MNADIFGPIVMFLLTLLIGLPLGKYMAKVFANEKTFLDVLMNPTEKLLYQLAGVDAQQEQNWKKQMVILLTINFIWFFLGIYIFTNQSWLPLNPDHNSNQTLSQALNTTISFLVNCDLQHYSGETGVSYLGQLYLMFLQFVSAATGMAAAVTVFYALRKGSHNMQGNFYNFFLKSITRLLLPISIIIGIILIFCGTPMTFEGKQAMTTLQGDSINVSTGPVAAFVAIKHLGTNGGGFYGANSSHPLENPTYLTNMIEMISQMIIPFAMVFALGFFLKKRKMSRMIWGVMTVGFLLLVIPTIMMEMNGNSNIEAMGVDTSAGNMEGKEVRFGSAASAFWSIATTVISTGSVNSMHDSFMPLSGMNMLIAMMTNTFYGGVGVGILNFFVFIILAVFISGLMVGRTPEFLGKKIEAREIKIAMIVALFHPFLILIGTALTVASPSLYAHSLNNAGFHGFSEILYEFTSASANNGSGFEGLGDNTLWWNLSTGFVLFLSRYISIIGPVAIAGSLSNKKYIPESAGTLKTDNSTFGIMVFVVIIIIAALSFFPSLALGPIADYFTMTH